MRTGMSNKVSITSDAILNKSSDISCGQEGIDYGIVTGDGLKGGITCFRWIYSYFK